VENPWSHVSAGSLVIVASEFEGDGMNVVEAVANGNPILLADNSDLRRFDFPEVNYFKSLNELISKVEEVKQIGRKHLVLSSSKRRKLLEDREPQKVADQWLQIFNGSNL
jgi:glycosyltransferase involved in cell wall biosynthesis